MYGMEEKKIIVCSNFCGYKCNLLTSLSYRDRLALLYLSQTTKHKQAIKSHNSGLFQGLKGIEMDSAG